MKKLLKLIKLKYLKYLAIIPLIIVIVFTFFFQKKIDEVYFENHKFYQYLSGIKFDYEGKIKLNKDKNITKIIFDEVSVTLDSTPIYYAGEKKVLFPKNMNLVYPISGGLQYKVNYFSTLESENNILYLQDGKLRKELLSCFLYDGNDLYFFIDETKIIVQNKEYILSPFSYVILKHNQSIEIYDIKNDNYQIIELDNQEIKAVSNGYTINLSIDAINYSGKSRLLIKNTDFLNKL